MQWPNTEWHDARYELKQSRLLDPGQYALVMFKRPEEPTENYHAVIPTFAQKDDGAYLTTRTTPDGVWRKGDAITSFGVFGHQETAAPMP